MERTRDLKSIQSVGKVAYANRNNFGSIVNQWFQERPSLLLIVRGGPLANCSDWPRHELVEKLKLLFYFAAKTEAVVLVSGVRCDIDSQLTRLNSKFKQTVKFIGVVDEGENTSLDPNLTHTLLTKFPDDIRAGLETYWQCPRFQNLLGKQPSEDLYNKFAHNLILLENNFERQIANLKFSPIETFSLISHNESICADFLENCPIDDYNAILGSTELIERVVSALLKDEVFFVRLVCQQFQNLRSSPNISKTIYRLFAADEAANPGQFIHERIRFWLLEYFAGVQGFNFDRCPLNMENDDFFHTILVWALVNSKAEVAAHCLPRLRRNLLPNAAVAAHVLKCPVAMAILTDCFGKLSISEHEQVMNFRCSQWGDVRLKKLLSPLQKLDINSIIQEHISSRWYGALIPLRKKRNYTFFIISFFCPLMAKFSVKKQNQSTSISASTGQFLAVPFVQHIYGTLFYLVMLVLYSIVLLQKFYSSPQPEEYLVYALQGLNFALAVFTVVRDWRNANEFIWHRSLVNLSTGISWILLSFAIIMRSITSSETESRYDVEQCGNFTETNILDTDVRCMRTHSIIPVITIAYLFYALIWIFFTLKVMAQEHQLPASWHSDILSSSLEEIQGISPPLDETQQKEMQKLQTNISKKLMFEKLEEKVTGKNEGDGKRELDKMNEKIALLHANLEEMQVSLEESISSVGGKPIVKIRTPTPLPTPPPPTPPPVMVTTSAQTDPLPKPTREECLEHMSLDGFPSDFEIYGMTRSTLNSRNRRISRAESEPKGAKRSTERITGEVTKEPKEQQSPPLFCVWGRSVENSTDSNRLIKDHFEEPTIIQRVSTIQSHITAIVEKSAAKWRLSRSSLPGQKPKFPVPDENLKWDAPWEDYDPVVIGLPQSIPKNATLNKIGRTGGVGVGRLDKPGANKVSYMLVVSGRRFLARGCTSNEHQLPFWIHKDGENKIQDLENYLERVSNILVSVVLVTIVKTFEGINFFVASSDNTIDSIYNTDHAWLEGDFLIATVEDIDPKWELKEKFDLVWADANVLRYFNRMEQKIIKFILQQRNLQEVVYNLPSRK
ncbi:Oidioi.mRNA.OKI2018_I69.XSR.g13863.t1.cds [Oikopleura dioica]|uniref:Oidioi.mRNA.OKI2018_I69.XSR.g13863.t1.cds n=1 Tax=Oikopleura dioica TaxID=34765 RepID=A0ABN7SD86_OIKDI|nr:Oidioi.mRNA.OKI2018_I69.XSR.g13863.t1.cds [Oikopleura dioica]